MSLTRPLPGGLQVRDRGRKHIIPENWAVVNPMGRNGISMVCSTIRTSLGDEDLGFVRPRREGGGNGAEGEEGRTEGRREGGRNFLSGCGSVCL